MLFYDDVFCRMRMSEKGIKKVRGHGHGDHYINIKIQPPKTLTDKQAAVLKVFAELETNTPGTVMGLTYQVGGKKVVMEDKDGMVADIRSENLNNYIGIVIIFCI